VKTDRGFIMPIDLLITLGLLFRKLKINYNLQLQLLFLFIKSDVAPLYANQLRAGLEKKERSQSISGWVLLRSTAAEN
jgi:hypothetical protein